ncbi:polysaccharide pyruvyl transferase family protein [Blastopirellula marina]|uniref:Succinoglycan biosynthesis ketolase n=1 Tax=Blastopirellula marina TaxID=124 RepID=A0A2S8GHG1_9BACT|nr:polysaccharide pyruvyl transferase family protein [Blastopirellula marina]PQO43895.1 succinoglycan biosynthesis ketolase [Blastopirellula marina]
MSHIESSLPTTLYYYKDPRGNFGDDLNPWIFPRLLGREFKFADFSSSEPTLIGIGTLLGQEFPEKVRKIVFSTGAGYGTSKPTASPNWDIRCVRGPLTAKLLGLDPKLAITDGAILLAALREHLPAPRTGLPSKIGVFLHHKSATERNWRPICEQAGLHYLDPHQSVEDTLAEMQSLDCIICEAMHGAIVADTLRIPWIPIKIYSHINEFKWNDWTRSLNLDFFPVSSPFPMSIPRLSTSRQVVNKAYHACVDFLTSKNVELSQWLRLVSRSDVRYLSADRDFNDRLERLVDLAGEL